MTDSNWDKKLSKLFKSKKTPPTNPLLDDFEEKLWKMVKNIKFREHPFRNLPY